MAEGNLTEKTYKQIKQMMINYELIPGQRLTFTDLAEKMGVSRTPVNNALTLLAKEGFLDFTPNQGYTVHQITKEEADALYEVREIIEIGAIEKIIENVTPEKLEAVEELQRQFEQAVKEKVSRGRFFLDQEFHAGIIALSGNALLTDYFRDVYQRIFLRHRVSPLRGERALQAPAEHTDVIDAIRERDLDKARAAIRHHVRAGRDYIYSFIFE